MSAPVPDDVLQHTIAIVVARGSRMAAAKLLGLSVEAIARRLRVAAERGLDLSGLPQAGKSVNPVRTPRPRKRQTAPALPVPPLYQQDAVVVQLTDAELATTWRVYLRDTAREDLRNCLAVHYLSWFDHVVSRAMQDLPEHIDKDELRLAALEQLLLVIPRYEPGRGIRFEAFARPRVCGAILDAIRANEHVPRLVRTRQQRLLQVAHELTQKLGHPATRDELCDVLGWTAAELAEAEVVHEFISSGSRQLRQIPTRLHLGDEPIDPIMFEMLTYGMKTSDKVVLYLYHVKNKTMDEIAAVLDVSTSRVSQIYQALLNRIRERYKPDELYELLS